MTHIILPITLIEGTDILQTVPELLAYGLLYTQAQTDDDYDGLINEDGLKLFIDLPETDAINAGVLNALHYKGLIKVVPQKQGKQPIVFVNSPSSSINAKSVQMKMPLHKLEPIANPELTAEPELASTQEPVKSVTTQIPIREEVTAPCADASASYDQNTITISEPEILAKQEFSKPDTVPFDTKSAAVYDRRKVLRAACNNEFGASDTHDIWISMQGEIDEKYWDDMDYLYGWLSERYKLMDSKVKGGDTMARQGLLMRIIEGES